MVELEEHAARRPGSPLSFSSSGVPFFFFFFYEPQAESQLGVPPHAFFPFSFFLVSSPSFKFMCCAVHAFSFSP